MIYTGIGSRETPDDVCDLMSSLAMKLRIRGFTLRSGGAKGADSAFEKGAGSLKEIFTSSDATSEALELASRYHPNWGRCNDWARALHARNGFQILGRDLKSPTDFVICWTKDGKASGGTGQALRIAKDFNIPVFNLHNLDNVQEALSYAEDLF